jgi:thiamine pyrophosphokinase
MPAEERVRGKGTVVVVAAGAGPDVARALPPGATVIAADGGLDRALALGLTPRLVVGDMDSISGAALADAERAGAMVVRHPAAKDSADLELALDEALAVSPARIVVVASAAGRLDHLLASLLLLGSEKLAAVEVDAVVGEATVHVVRTERVLRGSAGQLLTLLALHGPAEGVVTSGLTYPLRGETLWPGSSRGLSNVFVDEEARVSVERGVVLAIRPEGR